MIVLAIDTSGAACSAALLRGEAVVAARREVLSRTHSTALMPMIDAVLAEAGVDIGEVDAFAAVIGPGSFTGVRIGVSTAKAFGHALNRPVAGVDAPGALAYGTRGAVVAMIDARNGQVYAAEFVDGERVCNDKVGHVSEFLRAGAVYIGDGAEANAGIIGEGRILGGVRIRAENVAKLAIARGFSDYNAVLPEYVRASQAQREWDARNV